MINFYHSLLGCGSEISRRQPRTSKPNKKDGRVITPSTISGLPSTYINSVDLTRFTPSLSEPANANKCDNCGVVSNRAKVVLSTPSVTMKYNQKVGADIYNPLTNPKGYVDLGLAENKLCEDLITEKLQTIEDDSGSINLRYYPDVKGVQSFRNSLKTFLETEFDSHQPLDANNIIVACGVTALLDALGFSLADEGDYIMTTSPYYYRIKNDMFERAGVNTLEVPLVAKPKSSHTKPYSLDINRLETSYLEAVKSGKRVKAVLIVNPNNPLGDVYTAQQLQALLDFAARYKLYVIVDEIYAMSVFDPEVTFTSILSLNQPDPDRVIFLWGFSKDFGLSGYRCGVLYSTNTTLISYLASLGIYQLTPPVVQRRLKHFIDDREWLHATYLPTLRRRLQKHHKMFQDALTRCGLDVHPCSGAIFIWIDASKYLPEETFLAEEWLFEEFMKEKVFLLPGQACYSQKPGCFRIVFSLDENTSTEGIKRIQNVLRRIRPSHLPNGF